MSTDIATLINAIPTAEDGHVITQDYHNSLRHAVVALADLLDPNRNASGNVVLSLPPGFLANAPGPNWSQTNGVASPVREGGGAATAAASANGWIPLHLPQGVRIRNMTVKGFRCGITITFEVRLVRVKHTDPDPPINLITMKLTPASDNVESFKDTQSVAIPENAGPEVSAIVRADYETVVNSDYSYLIVAEASGVKGNMVAKILSIQVEYSRA